MKRKEFLELVKKAEGISYDQFPWDEMQPIFGIATHKERRMTTLNGAMAFLRYQAMQFNGTWDFAELESCSEYFKRVDLIGR